MRQKKDFSSMQSWVEDSRNIKHISLQVTNYPKMMIFSTKFFSLYNKCWNFFWVYVPWSLHTHWLNNAHHKQLNLNITQILRLTCESQLLVYQVFFLNVSKQLSSWSCLLLSTLSQYFIPMTQNVWLPRTPKCEPFPRKTLGQLKHQIHFLALLSFSWRLLLTF